MPPASPSPIPVVTPSPYPPMPDPKDIVEIVDHASSMSDRWLFLATIIIFLIALIVAIRWIINYFTKRTDKLEKEIVEVREKHVKYIIEESAKTASLLERCVKVLENIKLPLIALLTGISTLLLPMCSMTIPLGKEAQYGEVFVGYRLPSRNHTIGALTIYDK